MRKFKLFTGKMANEQNLKPFDTEKKARENGRKGGIASGKVKKKKKQVKDLLKTLLGTKPNLQDIKKIQAVFPDIDIKTIEDVLNLSMIRQGIKGNVQAYNAVYDRVEGKPQQKTDITSGGERIVEKIIYQVPKNANNNQADDKTT